ncbi:MAG: DUF3267 domain-containing protein [Oscillospiraceae bacterium]|nr:DUF3267 domain-containing protein [Oscillospiraceae bacterium]
MLKETFELDKFEKVDKVISFVKANVYSIFVLLPLAALCVYIYIRVQSPTTDSFNGFAFSFNMLLGCFYSIFLIVLHELTHAFVFAFFCKNKHKSIKFGIDKKTLSPYCHCKEILTISQYRLGGAAPLFTTGLLPFLIALITGYSPLMVASILLIIGAGGDYTILLMLIKEEKTSFVEDHPTLVGCVVYRTLHEVDK